MNYLFIDTNTYQYKHRQYSGPSPDTSIIRSSLVVTVLDICILPAQECVNQDILDSALEFLKGISIIQCRQMVWNTIYVRPRTSEGILKKAERPIYIISEHPLNLFEHFWLGTLSLITINIDIYIQRITVQSCLYLSSSILLSRKC